MGLRAGLDDYLMRYGVQDLWRHTALYGVRLPPLLSPTTAPTTYTAAELQAMEFAPVQAFVPGLIVPGLTLLVGASKLGKSWLALGLCLAVATGSPALGKLPTRKAGVFYAALEDSPRRLQARQDQILGEGLAPGNVHILHKLPRLGDGGEAALEAELQAHPDIGLMVIDVLGRIKPKGKKGENSYDADTDMLAPLQQLAHRYGVAIVIVHHTNRGAKADWLDSVNGTTGLAGVSDSILVLQRARGQPGAILHATGRDIDEVDHALQFDRDAGTWCIQGDAQALLLSQERKDVIELLGRKGPLGPTEIAEQLSKTPGATRKLLAAMARDGHLEQPINRGPYQLPTKEDADAQYI